MIQISTHSWKAQWENEQAVGNFWSGKHSISHSSPKAYPHPEICDPEKAIGVRILR